MFKIALGLHPLNIINIFNKTINFDRNLDFTQITAPYAYLQRQIPISLISSWNSLPLSFRGWLKEQPSTKVTSKPSRVFQANDPKSYNTKIKGFKDAITQSTITNYKHLGRCNNTRCNDCLPVQNS